MNHGGTAPGVPAHIDANRAVIRTNAALHATRWVRYHLSRREKRMFAWSTVEEYGESHGLIRHRLQEKTSLLFFIPGRL